MPSIVAGTCSTISSLHFSNHGLGGEGTQEWKPWKGLQAERDARIPRFRPSLTRRAPRWGRDFRRCAEAAAAVAE